jgi:glycosyltransferase involved in cell wall biosynthesis
VGVSLIATVYNEGESIRGLMDSLVMQTRQPDEIVIVDGGSRDSTVAVLEGYRDRLPLHVIVESGANISRGRNLAIENARHEIIAVTDAGVRLEPTWLANLLAPFDTDPELSGVSGFFQADPRTAFEAAMGATVLPTREDIDPTTFLPSSRSIAFKREAWQAAGGYPEWLDYCEDLVFDLRLIQKTGSLPFAGDAIVHFRPRTSLRAFYRQYYLYARGDGKADLWRKRHAIRYLTYCVGFPALVLLSWLVSPLFLVALAIGGLLYCRRPLERLPATLKSLPKPATARQTLQAYLWVPVIRAIGDIAKMIGYPVGTRWRLRHQPPDWRTQ